MKKILTYSTTTINVYPVATVRRCVFVGSTHKALLSMPAAVRSRFGYALHLAQIGDEADNAKALKGFGGRGVLEIIEDHDSGTYRAVYTIRFSSGVYVLHVFQKKSKTGIATPDHEIALIRQRLKMAETLHQAFAHGYE